MGKIANIVSFPSIGLACASELGLERVCRLWRWQRIDSSRSSYLAILFGAKQRGLSIQVCTLLCQVFTFKLLIILSWSLLQ